MNLETKKKDILKDAVGKKAESAFEKKESPAEQKYDKKMGETETSEEKGAGGPGKFPFKKYGKIKKNVAKATKGY